MGRGLLHKARVALGRDFAADMTAYQCSGVC